MKSKPRPKIFIDHSLSAEILRQGRLQRGLTQRGMADRLDMEAGTYSSCENGKRRFPVQRLRLLPPELAVEVRNALVEEFGMDLDRRIAGQKPIPAPSPRKQRNIVKTLAADRRAALD